MRTPRNATGLTIIELAVAVGILALIITGTGYVFKQTAKATRLTQAGIERNANIRAVTAQLRDDFQGICKDGFLCIFDSTVVTEANKGEVMKSPPILMFTATGTYNPRNLKSTDPAKTANAAIITYQPMKNAFEGNELTILGRTVRLLMGAGPDVDDLSAAYLGVPRFYAMLGSWSGKAGGGHLQDKVIAGELAPTAFWNLNSVPEDLNGVDALWPYMIGGCRGMEITFCDGRKRGDYSQRTEAGQPAEWLTATDAVKRSWPTGVCVYVGSKRIGTATTNANYVMWTAADRDSWPRAIRVALTLQDIGQQTEPERHEFVISFP